MNSASKEGRSLNNYCLRRLLGDEPADPIIHAPNLPKPANTIVSDDPHEYIDDILNLPKCELCNLPSEVRYFMGDDGDWHISCLLCYLVRNPKMSKSWQKALKKPNL